MAKRTRKRLNRLKKIRLTPANIAIFVLAAMFFTVYAVYAYQETGTVIPTMELVDGHANFRFVNVGQGDCTLVTHHGDAVLVDAGPGSAGKTAAEYVRLFSPTVDYFIITHPHEDHMGGAAEILQSVKVDCLVLPMDRVDEDFYRNAVAIADRRGIEILYVDEGITLTTEYLTVEILDTFDLEVSDLNDASMITKITADGTTLLVTGDAESAEEEYLLTRHGPALDTDILKVAHHGSSTSSGAEFLAAVSPDTAVISCGRNNSYGHPASEVVTRLKDTGCEIRRTDFEGNVVVRNGMTPAEWVRSLFDQAG